MARPDGEPSGIKTDRIPPVVVEGPPCELLAAGRVLANRYELLALIGKGGMGEVWRAHDRKLEEDIALKVLLPERLHDPEMLKNLRSEVKHARRISHANVCRVFDVGEDGELLFLTMELIEGRTLRALLTTGALAPEATLGMLQQIVEGLAAVHAKGIIHRDLKPENVLVRSATGQPVVADFGLARIPVADQRFTDVAGTPAYMSPEQLRGDPLDARSDIFSLGLLAFEMLTGSLPFGGGSSVTKNRGIFRVPPNRLHVTALPPPFVRSLDKVLARAMAQDPADRYASAAEFGVALGSVRESNPLARANDEPASAARRVGQWLQRRRLNRWAAFGLAAALPTVAAAAVALNVRSGSDDPRPAILVAPLENLTGDPSWNGLAQGAVEAIRTGLRTIPQVRLIDGPRAEARLTGGRSNATWVAAGSVQRVGASLRLEVQLRAAGGAAVGEPIEIDGDPADPSPLPETLRRRALGEVRLLVNDYDRRRRAETGTKNPIAKARLREYYALINPTPRPEDFENGERLLDEALAADPRYVPALIERATLRLQVGRSHAKPETRAAALADVERAIAIDPKEPNALTFRCRAMQIESNFSDRSTDAAIATAIDACNDALRADPASAHARLALARLHESACQTEIAMTSLQRALEPEVDRSLSGWLYMQLVHVALQEGKISLADRVSQQLVDFYEEERRLGGRAYSRRAGVLPIQGAHMLRAAVLMRLGQPESLEKARQELLGELDTMSGGIGDRWNEAAALRGLLRIAQLRGDTPPSAWKERLGSLERDYRAIAQENPGVLHGAALSYRWIAPEGALELIGMLGPPASFQEAFDRALISHAAGNDQEARRALELHPATERWEQRCHSWIQSQLAY
ncbi:MAG: protein kinase [Polyangiaceae bacterium]|nr:protein kinase [Polyangiaceae bacterium]